MNHRLNSVNADKPTYYSNIDCKFRVGILQEHLELLAASTTDGNGQFEVLWLKEGRGQIRTTTQTISLAGEVLYFITPGQPRQITLDNTSRGYYLSFNHDFLCDLESSVKFPFLLDQFGQGGNICSIRPEADLEENLRKIIEEARHAYMLRGEILNGLFKVFLVYLSRYVNKDEIVISFDREQELVRRFMTLIKQQHTTQKMVSQYADELCVSPNHLNAVVKRVTRFPAGYHIRQYLIKEAKRHALYSGLSMKQVASLLGFYDTAHFSRFFKNYCGINYSSWQRSSLIGKGHLIYSGHTSAAA
ncbi:helix-turn-helix domain-containing protein [Parachryseolinea silvisoli]|uniref:helix-turn-helix domain-containing protein n=1 Tax=Parachryseolinea silvisoli TaxID=2873601 RepID=UPI00226598C0|nr:helix-turn-helix domain-containing protein [Parachryseolinea silvisoli]MCD9017684.1 helix-turn-helix domain-containing protein [Parachryseolinea silvisoli]